MVNAAATFSRRRTQAETEADMLERIVELFAYTRWANNRILDATARLSQDQLTRDLGNSFPSVRDTLLHIIGAEWVWLSRWNGVSPGALPAWSDVASHDAIRQRFGEIDAERAAYLDRLDPVALNEVIHYRNLKGDSLSGPLWQLHLHVVNHSTYHRGQVVTMLRQLGHSAPSTDLVQFYRERAIVANVSVG
jgi:uncharacterized damage-inducible protein DinB